MRSSHIAAVLAGFFLVVPTPDSASAATANVLLPDDNNSSNTDTSVPTGTSASGNNDSNPLLQPEQLPPPNASNMLAVNPSPFNLSPMSVPDKAPGANPSASIYQPTNIMKMPVMDKSITDAMGKGLPSTLNIGFADSPILGDRDKRFISKRLGIPADQTTSACSLIMSGSVQTDKSIYMQPVIMSAPHISIKYDGKLKSARIAITALCTAGAAPPANAGTIFQMGDKYISPLAQVSCPTPDGNFTTLTIKYNGDSQGQCAYQ